MGIKRRYFYVVFIFRSSHGCLGNGSITLSTDGSYLNKLQFEKYISNLENCKNCSDIVITNIIELSQQDFMDFEQKVE